MKNFADVQHMLRALAPANPVYCIYPHVYTATTGRFLSGFPGRVLYAIKANNHPAVIQCLLDAGIRHFDCASLVEVEQVRAADSNVNVYFMNPVRIRGAARAAQQEHGVRHFVIDHESALEPLLDEIDPGRSVIFARMAVHHFASRVDLSTKFGAKPEDVVPLLLAIAGSGAEPALAFNVGSFVTSPDAYTHAFETTRTVLDSLPFKIRLLDIGGGFPKSYPGIEVPPLEAFFDAIREFGRLPLSENGELLAEPGRALAARGMSIVAQVLLRKGDRLYLNDGMYGSFWELRYKVQERFAARTYRNTEVLDGGTTPFRLYGPTCDSGDMLPGLVELPESIAAGDYIEFGSAGAYSLSGRTDFNGFFSDTVVRIEAAGSRPPT